MNHRFLDIKLRLGREWLPLESQVKAALRGRLDRGHLDVLVDLETHVEQGQEIVVDQPLARRLHATLSELSDELGCSEGVALSDVLRFSNVVGIQRVRVDPKEEKASFLRALAEATDLLIQMRIDEGERLAMDLRERVAGLRSKATAIREALPALIEAHRERLRGRLEQLLAHADSVDATRLEQEVAILADKTDVSEELTRIDSHLEEIERILTESDGPAGKKLEFLTQELSREVNTIGSKVGDVGVTRLVVDAKCELEKVREQVANIE